MDIITNGINNGGIYALLAVGFVLIYRNTRVPNFCHAETGMFGAYICFTMLRIHLPYGVAILIGVSVSSILAAGVRLLFANRENNVLMMLLGTLGVAGLLTYLADRLWVHFSVTLPLLVSGPNIHLGDGIINGQSLVILGVAAVAALGAFLYLRFSRNGLLFRAASMNRDVAQLLGANVGVMSTLTWAFAGATSGLAAILLAPDIAVLTSDYMTTIFISALTASVMAGMRSLIGCIWAGLALGIIEAAIVSKTSTPGLQYLVLLVIVVVLIGTRSRSLARRTA